MSPVPRKALTVAVAALRSGVIHDPAGLDITELRRLAKLRSMIKDFDTSKLSAKVRAPPPPPPPPRAKSLASCGWSVQGFRVLVGDANVTLPDGFVVENGTLFRNQYHLLPYSSADIFVPCGGRCARAARAHRR